MSKLTPARGEIWLVDFDPAIGTEIRKTRPAIVVSADSVGILPIKIVAPLTEWKDVFKSRPWLVRVDPDARNCLNKTSAADVLQIRGLDLARFVTKIGVLSPTRLDEVTAAIGVVVRIR